MRQPCLRFYVFCQYFFESLEADERNKVLVLAELKNQPKQGCGQKRHAG